MPERLRVILVGAGTRARDFYAPLCQTMMDDLGIDLAGVRLLCAKAKNHFRAAFGPLCGAIVEVDAPGPAGYDLGKFPFRHAPRPFVRALSEA